MKQQTSLAVAIVLGMGLVAAAIYTSGPSVIAVVSGEGGEELPIKREFNDWVYGNSSARVSIVEFSDFECPYCSRVHPTIKQIVDESDGQINWHYRHFPLPSHKNAELAAAVSECVGRLGGNEKFWLFADEVFANQRNVNETYLKAAAGEVGIATDDLSACLNDESIRSQIALDLATVRALGGSGTPFSVIVNEDGAVTPVRGALGYDSWLSLLNKGLDNE